MTEKRSFPDDWSQLSYGQVAGNILYLLEHYKDYEIKRINKNNILIDRNIRLSKVKFQENAFIINGRMFEEITKQHSIYDKLEKIFEECEQEIIQDNYAFIEFYEEFKNENLKNYDRKIY